MGVQVNRLMAAFVMSSFLWMSQANGHGIVIPGAGPVNRSMCGASVAAPLDAAGATLWHPAAVTALESSEFVLSAELLQVTTHLASSAGPFSGESRSDSGVNGLPTAAVVFQPEDSPWTYGLGLFAIGGFAQNYPDNPTNPIQSPAGADLGAIYSKLSVLELVPTIGLKVTDRMSVGFAPTFVVAEAALDPNPFAPPTASGYPAATHARPHWGMGFKAGIYYETDCDFRFGASYRSPQWIEDFTFFTNPATQLSLAADYPGVTSLGVSYYGLPRTIWAMDVRYLDYDNTELFGHGTGYNPDGSWTGLGWKSIFSIATGVQYQLNDGLSVRCGYLYSENPVRDADAFFNVASSAIYQHILSVGATWQITCRTGLSIAYLKALENDITGPWVVPPGVALPGTSVTERQSVDALVAGLQVKF